MFFFCCRLLHGASRLSRSWFIDMDASERSAPHFIHFFVAYVLLLALLVHMHRYPLHKPLLVHSDTHTHETALGKAGSAAVVSLWRLIAVLQYE